MTPQERAAAIIEKWRLKGQGYTGELEDDIAAAIEAMATTTRQETLDDVCRLVCKWCAAGRPVEPVSDGYWLHPSVTPDLDHWEWCDAARIRDLMTTPEAAPHAP